MRPTTLWFLALGLAVATTACGGDDDGGGEPTDSGTGEDTGTGSRDAGVDSGPGPMDAGGMDAGPSTTLDECDPFAEATGCADDEKCAVVLDQSDEENVFVVFACVPASTGGKARGIPCARFGQDPTPDIDGDELYTDECAEGLFCFRRVGDTLDRCQKVCGDCEASAYCNPVNDEPAFGICIEAEGCDPVFQTGCTGDDNCYLISNTMGDALGSCFEFVPEMDGGTGAPGEACTFINNCRRGVQCYPDFYPDGGASAERTCKAFCNAGTPGDGGVGDAGPDDAGTPMDAGAPMDGGAPTDGGPTFTGDCEGATTCVEIPQEDGTAMVPTTPGVCQ